MMKILFASLLLAFIFSGCSKTNVEENKPVAMTVFKSPTCGCCKDWITHIEQQHFTVTVEEPLDLNAVKDALGLKPKYHSCHTGVTQSGYVFEGHIPAKVIQQFLRNPPPQALGLTVPGMPLGSPGMEIEQRFTPYDVLLLNKDGSSRVYKHIAQQAEQY